MKITKKNTCRKGSISDFSFLKNQEITSTDQRIPLNTENFITYQEILSMVAAVGVATRIKIRDRRISLS